MSYQFISYSSVDGKDFALRLADALEAGPPSFPVWLDKRKLRPGDDWDEQLAEAIRNCECLLFVMTPDSVASNSVAKQEWTRALKYKKPVIPLLLDSQAEMPFRLEPRQHIDFSGDFDSALARLRTQLQWRGTPEGRLQGLKDRLADAQRDLRRAADPLQQTRIQDEIDQLERDIAEQQRILANPQAAAQRVQESIQRGMDRERQPVQPPAGAVRSKFINPPPGIAPIYFQDRHLETGLVGKYLQDESKRMLTVVGRGGIGKTAMVCRLLKSLENGRLPEDGGPLEVEGIVYLSATSSRGLKTPHLFADLSRLLPEDTANRLDALYKDPAASTREKMEALLAEFPAGRTILLLDNFEDVVDPQTFEICDPELDEALCALLEAPHHAVKTILTTRIAPRSLALAQPGRQSRLDLDEGLPSPFAENILKLMDVDGKVGLRDAPQELLDEARQRTRGYPRALEALFAILSADRDATLEEVLADATRLLPENVVEVLVGEAISRLDHSATLALQALAIYGRPVSPAAVDYLLQPYLPGVDSAPILNRLVNMHFVRREARRYYLHPVDRSYALSHIPRGEPGDRDLIAQPQPGGADPPQEAGEAGPPPFTQFALLHRGAEYFKQTRLPRLDWKTIDDLAAQLAEFELRYAGQDYDTAAETLLEIDFNYLHTWGYFRLEAELHERLRGRLEDTGLVRGSLDMLGQAYYRLGRYQPALACFEEALEIARQRQERQAEGILLGLTGLVYSDLGQTARSTDFYEQALEIARELEDRDSTAIWLGNLAINYRSLGQMEQTIDYYLQALDIARELGSQRQEVRHLLNLAISYHETGQASLAKEYLEQSQALYPVVQDRLGYATGFGLQAEILTEAGDLAGAEANARQYAQIVDEMGIQASYSNGLLAEISMLKGDLPAARQSAEAALRYDEPLNNHNIRALLGIICLRQGDRKAAEREFTTALELAQEQIDHNPQNYDALETQALAHSGLAMVLAGAGPVSPANPDLQEQVEAALQGYRAARQITRAAGIVRNDLRLLDALAYAHPQGVSLLAPARQAASGY